MLGQLTQNISPDASVWHAEEVECSQQPQPVAWARYIESRLQHFERSGNAGCVPMPLAPMIAPRDD